jgi:hypothetical protein
VDDAWETAALMERALSYPYATPERSYLYRAGGAMELLDAGLDLSGRTPLLAYGANCSPRVLAGKLGSAPEVELPVLRAELEDFDVAYSAHISPYGAVPATLIESPGTVAPVFVLYPDRRQRELLSATELNYDLVTLDGVCRIDGGPAVTGLSAYLSKHGCLEIDGSPVALSAVRSRGRGLPELDEPAVLERVRATLAPDLTLEEFIHTCVKRGGMTI